MKHKNELTDLTAIIRHETRFAYLFDFGDKKGIWLPKSQIEIEQNRDGKTVTVTLPVWIAEEKRIV